MVAKTRYIYIILSRVCNVPKHPSMSDLERDHLTDIYMYTSTKAVHVVVKHVYQVFCDSNLCFASHTIGK